jgi:DNA helicase-2/ATP-dependent DNA helicase PcrA
MKLEDATPEQREAITSDAADIMLCAGPGSGKTATLVGRLSHRIAAGKAPSTFCCLTFTNAAARELSERVQKYHPGIELGFVGTLHSFALRMLRDHGSRLGYGTRIALIPPEASADLLQQKANQISRRPPPIDKLLKLKADLRPVVAGARFDEAETIVRTWRSEMRTAGLVDYDMLLQEFLALLTEPNEIATTAVLEIGARFRELYVSEVQDSAPIDWQIYKAMPVPLKFFEGDPDQAIYGFRGGRVAEMIGHSALPGVHTVKLEDNFRSGISICQHAQRLIEKNFGRLKKATISRVPKPGSVVLLRDVDSSHEEVSMISWQVKELQRRGIDTIAVLARTNDIANQFRVGLTESGCCMVEEEKKSLPRDFKLARAFLEMSIDPNNDALAFFFIIAREEFKGAAPLAARMQAAKQRQQANAAGKTLNGMFLHLSPITKPASALEALASIACRETRMIVAETLQTLPPGASLYDLALALAPLREYIKEATGHGCRVMTMHVSKGREFDAVFVVGFEDEVCPGVAARLTADAVEEERRLAYVACTRARDALFISYSNNRASKWGGEARRSPSRFIAELGLEQPII